MPVQIFIQKMFVRSSTSNFTELRMQHLQGSFYLSLDQILKFVTACFFLFILDMTKILILDMILDITLLTKSRSVKEGEGPEKGIRIWGRKSLQNVCKY